MSKTTIIYGLLIVICTACVQNRAELDDLAIITSQNYETIEQIDKFEPELEDDTVALANPGTVTSLVFNSDGSRLVSLSSRGMVTVRDTHTGDVIYFDSLKGLSDYFEATAYEPDSDVFAVASRGTSTLNGLAAIYNMQSGEEINRLSFDPTISQSIAFSSDETLLLISDNTPDTGRRERIIEWNYVTDEIATKFAVPHPEPGLSYTALGYVQEDSVLVTATNGIPAEIRAYQDDVPTGSVEKQSPSFSIAIRQDGQLIAIGGSGEAHIWRTSDLRLYNVIRGQRGAFSRLSSIAFHPVSSLVGFGTQSQIGLWNHAVENEFILFDHDDGFGAASVEFSPDGTLLAAGHWDGTIRIWGVRSRD